MFSQKQLFEMTSDPELLFKYLDAVWDYSSWKEKIAFIRNEYLSVANHRRSLIAKAGRKEELKKLVEEKRWSELLNIRPIKKGDFFFISSGTVHAIRKGTLILEIQQNSDITYRLYDYDRLQNGKPTELHTAKSLDVITCPQELKDTREAEKIYRGQKSQVLVDCPLFTVTKHMVSGADEVVIDNPYDFLIVNVLEGTGSVDGRKIKPGDSFIAPYGYRKLAFSGTLTFMTSHV